MDAVKNESGKTKLLIGTPCYGGMMYIDYFNATLRLSSLLTQLGIEYEVLTFGNESLITRARNSIVAYFLSKDFTHLLFIDSDIGYHPESVIRLLQSQKEVVACCYPKKGINWDKAKASVLESNGQIDSKDILTKSLDYNFNFKKSELKQDSASSSPSIKVENGFIKVGEAATGFLMIKREVLLKMKTSFPELKYVNDVVGYNMNESMKDNFFLFFDCMKCPETGRYLSEDFAFCKRWCGLGGEIYMDVISPLSHTGTFTFKGCLSSMFVPASSTS